MTRIFILSLFRGYSWRLRATYSILPIVCLSPALQSSTYTLCDNHLISNPTHPLHFTAWQCPSSQGLNNLLWTGWYQ